MTAPIWYLAANILTFLLFSDVPCEYFDEGRVIRKERTSNLSRSGLSSSSAGAAVRQTTAKGTMRRDQPTTASVKPKWKICRKRTLITTPKHLSARNVSESQQCAQSHRCCEMLQDLIAASYRSVGVKAHDLMVIAPRSIAKPVTRFPAYTHVDGEQAAFLGVILKVFL